MSKRFAVALTFAGENRTFVEAVAGVLSETLTRPKVFYDRYYEAELARANLDLYLQHIYHDDTELVVVVPCKEYNEKEWTGLEARAIRDLIKTRRDEDVMFVRIDEGDVSGIFGIDGFVDAKNRPAAEIAKVICERLEIVRSRSDPSNPVVDTSRQSEVNEIVRTVEIDFDGTGLRNPTSANSQIQTQKVTLTRVDGPRNLQLIVSILDESVRSRLVELINTSNQSGKLSTAVRGFNVTVDVLTGSTLNQHQHDTFSRLECCCVQKNAAAILISDCLAEEIGEFPEESWEPTSCAKEYQVRFGNRVFGTIAVLPTPQRVLDTDRTIRAHAGPAEVLKALELVASRLSYLEKPSQLAKIPERSIDIRVINTNRSEFLKYFELRHRIYRPMSYLSPEVEECESQMEMDWCDKKSIHIGAFIRIGAQERLVGTARLITDSTVTDDNEHLFRELAGNDYVLHAELNRALTLGLPLFESQRGANQMISDILRNHESCSELSRVIVAPEYRGIGLSEKLIECAINRAKKAGMHRLFLECLEIHRGLYEKMGFVCVPQLRGTVVGVDRTMIVMQLPPALLSPPMVEIN